MRKLIFSRRISVSIVSGRLLEMHRHNSGSAISVLSVISHLLIAESPYLNGEYFPGWSGMVLLSSR